MAGRVAVLGIFVVDLTFRAPRPPRLGETLIGSGFAMGCGGKGSNQAVAARRAGAGVSFITRIGDDDFGRLAGRTWKEEGIDACICPSDIATGAAHIFVNDESGDNAIIVYPGAGSGISAADVERHRSAIEQADVFVVQLEQPHDAALRGLQIARAAGRTTILNPAPASAPIDGELLSLSDFLVPNESEAAGLAGIEVDSEDSARQAAGRLLAAGAGTVLLTLGQRGVWMQDGDAGQLQPAIPSGAAVDTTGAGDSFVGALAAALAGGSSTAAAVRFGCAAAGISVTRPGTVAAMPALSEIEARMAE